MGRINLTNQVDPATPASGTTDLFVDSADKLIKTIDDTGTVRDLTIGVTAHGALTGLSDDNHSQYALLAGRASGQTLIGGTGSGDDLTLQSTSDGTKGSVFFGSTTTFYNETNNSFTIGGDLTVDTDTLHVDSTNNRVGIGTTSPDNDLHIVSSGGARIDLTSGTGFGGAIRAIGDQTAINANFFQFNAVNNGETIARLRLLTGSSGNRDDGAAAFFTKNSSGSLVEAFRVDDSQLMGVGESTPTAKLHVDQSVTNGARPVMLLKQQDVSEEMMELDGTTIGVGNAIEAVGAKTLTTTHFIKVTITGVGARYFPVGTIA